LHGNDERSRRLLAAWESHKKSSLRTALFAGPQSRVGNSASFGRDSRLHGNDERSRRLLAAWESHKKSSLRTALFAGPQSRVGAALALVEIPVCTGMTRGDVDCQSARE
jgi:hypothetical protein